MADTEERRVSKAYSELYHYTSIRALESILESDTLWATHIRHLNDSAELGGLLPRIERDFNGYIDSELTSGSIVTKETFTVYFQTMYNIMHATLNGAPDAPGELSHYVVSFAAHEQDRYRYNGMLSQWRGYGEHDCVAIVFDTKKLENLIESEIREFRHWPCFLADVIYDNGEEMANIFPDLSTDLLLMVQKLAKGEFEEFSSLFLHQLLPKLLVSASRWKHGGFSEENECRIVVGVSSPTLGELISTNESSKAKLFKKIRYRPGRNGSIPYVHLFDESKEHLPITRILLGPSINQKANLERVMQLIGTREIDILTSDIPFVGTARID